MFLGHANSGRDRVILQCRGVGRGVSPHVHMEAASEPGRALTGGRQGAALAQRGMPARHKATWWVVSRPHRPYCGHFPGSPRHRHSLVVTLALDCGDSPARDRLTMPPHGRCAHQGGPDCYTPIFLGPRPAAGVSCGLSKADGCHGVADRTEGRGLSRRHRGNPAWARWPRRPARTRRAVA